jgi:hypothetical protein
MNEYDPGSFGFHELLDRTYTLAENFADHISQHPSATHPKLRKRIEKIESSLFKLYQKIGQLHGEADGPR